MRSMSRLAYVLLVLVCAAIGATASSAQDQPIKRTELIRADVADVPGKETVIYIADAMPGGEGARHTHYGDEFVYILEGSLIVHPMERSPSP
jgi:quercetin dioxygenase-like cupin family protein